MSEITEDLYQQAQNDRINQLNNQRENADVGADCSEPKNGSGEWTDTEEAVIDAITDLEIAKLRHENALLRRQAELHEATRDRLREQRDAAIARVRRIRDLLSVENITLRTSSEV